MFGLNYHKCEKKTDILHNFCDFHAEFKVALDLIY